MDLPQEKLRQMQEQARILARERYFSASVAEKTIDFYREVLK